MSRWFKAQRMMWIGNRVLDTGRINRHEIMACFDISAQQASIDLRDFRTINPKAIRYDASAKAYVRALPHPTNGGPDHG